MKDPNANTELLQHEAEAKKETIGLLIWNLSALAAIYRERGDEQAATEVERDLWLALQREATEVEQ